MTFAKRVQSLREKAELGPHQLATLAGLSSAHVSIIERRDDDNPNVRTVAALARVLGCDLEYLATGEGEEPDAETVRAAVDAARAHSDDPTGPVATTGEPQAA